MINDKLIKEINLEELEDYVIKHSTNLENLKRKIEEEKRERIKKLPEGFKVKDYIEVFGNINSLKLNKTEFLLNRTQNRVNKYLGSENFTYAMLHSKIVSILVEDNVLIIDNTLENLLKKDFERLGWNFTYENECYTLKNKSPLGIDLVIGVKGSLQTFIFSVIATYTNFFPERYLNSQIENGSKMSNEDLFEDAKSVDKMFEALFLLLTEKYCL